MVFGPMKVARWAVFLVAGLTGLAGAQDVAGASADVEQLRRETQTLTLRGKWEEASAKLEARLGQKSSSREDLVALRAELGRVLADRSFFHRADPVRAEKVLKQVVVEAEAAGAKGALATALQGIGQLRYAEAFETQQWKPAQELFARAKALREGLPDQAALAESVFYLGLVEQMEGRYPAARKLFVQTLQLATEAKSGVMQSYAHRHLGGLDEEEGKLETARAHIESSIERRRASRFDVGVPFALMHLASFLSTRLGQPAQATTLLEEAIDLAGKSNSLRAEHLAQIQLAQLKLEAKRHQEAAKLATQAAAGARAFGDPGLVAEAEKLATEAARGVRAKTDAVQPRPTPEAQQ